MRNTHLIIGVFLSLLLLSGGCKKSAESEKDNGLKSGLVDFRNQSTLSVKIRRYSQTRNNDGRYKDVYKILQDGTTWTLPNLLDGGIKFKGGDIVKIRFQCKRTNWSDEKVAQFTVNGDKHVVVLNKFCAYTVD